MLPLMDHMNLSYFSTTGIIQGFLFMNLHGLTSSATTKMVWKFQSKFCEYRYRIERDDLG